MFNEKLKDNFKWWVENNVKGSSYDLFKTLFWNVLIGTVENHEKPQDSPAPVSIRNHAIAFGLSEGDYDI